MTISKKEILLLVLLLLTGVVVVLGTRFNRSTSSDHTESVTSVSESTFDITSTVEPEETTEEASTRHLNHHDPEVWKKMDLSNKYHKERHSVHDLLSLYYSINHSVPDLSLFEMYASKDLAKFLYDETNRLYSSEVRRTTKMILSDVISEKPLTIRAVIEGVVNSDNMKTERLVYHLSYNDNHTQIVSFEQVNE